jgi:hypothetical protein
MVFITPPPRRFPLADDGSAAFAWEAGAVSDVVSGENSVGSSMAESKLIAPRITPAVRWMNSRLSAKRRVSPLYIWM